MSWAHDLAIQILCIEKGLQSSVHYSCRGIGMKLVYVDDHSLQLQSWAAMH